TAVGAEPAFLELLRHRGGLLGRGGGLGHGGKTGVGAGQKDGAAGVFEWFPPPWGPPPRVGGAAGPAGGGRRGGRGARGGAGGADRGRPVLPVPLGCPAGGAFGLVDPQVRVAGAGLRLVVLIPDAAVAGLEPAAVPTGKLRVRRRGGRPQEPRVLRAGPADA